MPTQSDRLDRPASSPTVLDRSTVFRGAIFNVDDTHVRLHDGRMARLRDLRVSGRPRRPGRSTHCGRRA